MLLTIQILKKESLNYFLYFENYNITFIFLEGNGPSGIALSYMLSGNIPFVVSNNHPDEFLSARLTKVLNKSLINQDIPYLAQGLEGRTTNPVSLLLDALQHPCADIGLEIEPLIEWRKEGKEVYIHTLSWALTAGVHGSSLLQVVSSRVKTFCIRRFVVYADNFFMNQIALNSAAGCIQHSLSPCRNIKRKKFGHMANNLQETSTRDIQIVPLEKFFFIYFFKTIFILQNQSLNHIRPISLRTAAQLLFQYSEGLQR